MCDRPEKEREDGNKECPFGKTAFDFSLTGLNGLKGHKQQATNNAAQTNNITHLHIKVQVLCESRGGRPGLPVLMSLMVSVDVKQH